MGQSSPRALGDNTQSVFKQQMLNFPGRYCQIKCIRLVPNLHVQVRG